MLPFVLLLHLPPALHEMAMASSAGDKAVCNICYEPLEEGDVYTFQCGHPFHNECINTHSVVSGTPVTQMRCPGCKMSAAEAAEAEGGVADASFHKAVQDAQARAAELQGDGAVIEADNEGAVIAAAAGETPTGGEPSKGGEEDGGDEVSTALSYSFMGI